MLLTMDMGNTNITVGVFEKDALLFEARLMTDHARTGDEYAVLLHNILRLHDVEPSAFEGAVICSVVPSLDNALQRAVLSVTGCTPLFVGPGTRTGVNIRLDDPAQLGADLLVGAVAAIARYGAPCAVWDLGTATTVSVVGRDGSFLGGVILPGVVTSYDALSTRTSLLPHVRLQTPPRVIGRNTNDSMRSGAVFGTAAIVDGVTDRIEKEIGCPVKVIITGGLGREIAGQCLHPNVYDNELLLEGLRLIWEKNLRTPAEKNE
ncbi:MAG: type III pantothenate kinase [Clostridia bacterium]|nr:type III pantothenate kinase [Clostridia bacterium]